MALRNRKLPRHILVIRNSAMGDVAMVPHALRALREAYPDVRVTVLTRPLFKPFFAGLDVDFLEADYAGRHKGLRGLLRLAGEARRRGIDAVADVHGVLRSRIVGLLLRLHGMPAARIDKGRIEKWFRLGCTNPAASPLKHTVVRYCDVLRRLGFVFDDPQPAAKPVRPNPFGEKKGVWIGFAPFSAQAGKTYPEDLAAELVAGLSARYDRVFIHSGGGGEAAFAERMEREHPNVTALWGRVRFAGELDLIANLDCVVSMDSLAMHMASLVATPVVSVWGATHPALGFLGYGCPPEGVVQLDLPCRPCSVYGQRRCKFGDYRCMRIPPQAVLDRVEECLSIRRAEEAGCDCLVPKDNDTMETRIFLFLTLGALLAGCRNSATAPKRVRLNVEMSVSAGNRAALLENLLLLAEASRAEPGCIGYEIYENSRDSSRILIFETWRDAASLEAHQQTEHFRLRAPRNRELSETSVLSRFEF